MWGIVEALLQKPYSLCRLRIVGQQFLCLFYAANLILRRHLAFAALPRVELVGVELRHGLLVASQLVEQGDLL